MNRRVGRMNTYRSTDGSTIVASYRGAFLISVFRCHGSIDIIVTGEG